MVSERCSEGPLDTSEKQASAIVSRLLSLGLFLRGESFLRSSARGPSASKLADAYGRLSSAGYEYRGLAPAWEKWQASITFELGGAHLAG